MFAMLTASAAWSQVQPAANGGSNGGSDSQMATPPPVSGGAYPTGVGSETKSNVLGFGINASVGYIDNLYPGGSAASIGETTYAIHPSVAFDQIDGRQHRAFVYNSGYLFYRPTSALSASDQNASVDYRYRLTPHVTIEGTDTFDKGSTIFGLPTSPFGGSVSGSPQGTTPGIILPFANQINNAALVQMTDQISISAMVGASGSTTFLHYLDSAVSQGLNNSSSRGGSAFYNRRLSTSQYFGVNYNYSQLIASPTNAQSETLMHTISAFYTFYLKRTVSFSVSGGPQHYQVDESPYPTSSSWGPFFMASMGAQSFRTNFAVNYAQQVTGAGGLEGAFHSRSATASARWQALRTWTAAASALYATNRSVSPIAFFTALGGHSIAGTATVEHTLGRNLKIDFEYNRMHQSYRGVPALANNPNTNNEFVSVSWQFQRPVGR
jgi:hypothetical protein